MTQPNPPVLIVGAGPVGLTTALRLASFGVRSLLIDAKPHHIRQGSKACLIQGDVLEVLDKIGCADDIAEEGINWRIGHTHIRGQEIDRMVYPERPGFGQFVNISQYRIEQILLAAVEVNPLCEMRWDHTLAAFSQDDTEVRAVLETNDQQTEIAVRYLIGCDGIRSVVRNALGVEWQGYTHKDPFLITDIYTELDQTRERHFHFDPPFNPGRQLVMHPQPHNMWRIDWQLDPSADIPAEEASGALDERVRHVIGDRPYTIDWWSTYRFNQRVAGQFRVGRVLLAGDAAHALPPYGSRGMNSGIQDADNLAWRLASVLTQGASDRLLDQYHDERYAAARENLRVTEATIKFMVPPTWHARFARNALLHLARIAPFFKRFLNSGRMAEPFRYSDTGQLAGDLSDPLMGAFLPDAKIAGSGGRLRHLFGQSFVALAVCRSREQADQFRSKWDAACVNVRAYTILPSSMKDRRSDLYWADDTVPGDFAREAPYWLLLRPDGHVAAYVPISQTESIPVVLAKCGVAPETTKPVAHPSRNQRELEAAQ